jgi:cobalt/nickel transport system permease protein
VSFIDASIHRIARVVKSSYVQWETAEKDGLFQRIDPRVKLVFLLYFIVIVSLLKNVQAQSAVAAFVLMLALLSRLDVMHFFARVLVFAFLFGFLVTLPSALNLVTPGETLLPVMTFEHAHRLWIYTVPREITVTVQGALGVMMLTLRVANSLALSLLVIHTTPFFEIVRALKVFRVPDTLVMIIVLSYKYIFIFSRTVEDIYLALKARLVERASASRVRGLVAGRIYFIFNRSRIRYEETYRAMLARGFSGEMAVAALRRLTASDAAAGFALAACGVFLLFLGSAV